MGFHLFPLFFGLFGSRFCFDILKDFLAVCRSGKGTAVCGLLQTIPKCARGRESHRAPRAPLSVAVEEGGTRCCAPSQPLPLQPTKVAWPHFNKTDCAAPSLRMLMSDISVPCMLAGRPEDIK